MKMEGKQGEEGGEETTKMPRVQRDSEVNGSALLRLMMMIEACRLLKWQYEGYF